MQPSQTSRAPHLGAEDLHPLVVPVGGLAAVVDGYDHSVLEREHGQAGVDVARLPDGGVHLKKNKKNTTLHTD